MTTRREDTSHSSADNEAAARLYKERLDNRLDEALCETFPASDPVALTPHRRRLRPRRV
jgi:hypothetical protein